jgi:hypothetical protein
VCHWIRLVLNLSKVKLSTSLQAIFGVLSGVGMAIRWVVRRYIVRESIPVRQNSTNTRIHKRSWVWISTHTRRVSVIRRIPVTRPPTTILAFNIKQQFYHISKSIIIPAESNDNSTPNNMSWIKIEK